MALADQSLGGVRRTGNAPLVGTALVWVPAALVLAAEGRYGAAAFVALWGVLVVSVSDNFVRPLFISGRAQISTLTVFVALILALLEYAEQSRGKSNG